MYDEVYLAHHGIVGMKWGVRRFQNKDGSLTAEGRKRYAIDADGNIRKLTSKERKAVATAQKQKAVALEKARKARAEKAEYSKQKAEAIKSGDASKIEKYFTDLDEKELKEAMSRIQTKQSFQKALNEESRLIGEGKSRADRTIATLGKVTDYAETAIKFYNVLAKVNNAFNDTSFMPSIDGKWAGDRRRELIKQQREDAAAAKKEKEAKLKDRENSRKEKILNTGSAQDVLNYAKRHGNVTQQELGNAIKRMQNEEGLRKIARGGEEAKKVLKANS